MSSELSGKRLELLKSIAPGVSRIAVLLNPVTAIGPIQMREIEKAALAMGVRLQPLEVRSSGDLEPAFQAAAKGGAGALIALDDALRIQRVCGRWRTHVLCAGPRRDVPPRRNVRG